MVLGCDIQFSLLLFCCVSSTLSYRKPPDNSILEIVNTKEVERLIAEREYNKSLEERRFLFDNDLNENYLSSSESDYSFSGSEYEVVENKQDTFVGEIRKANNPRISIDVLFRRNNSTDPYSEIELLSDLKGYHGKKLLKSSKNALVVTKEEYLQRDWCKTEPLIQKIKEEGCLTRTVINRFCYGQCNSFYIPKNTRRRNRRRPSHGRPITQSDEDEGFSMAFKSCAFCKPKKFTWITVTLKCPSMMPQFRRKRIQVIKQCKCIAINSN